MARRSRGFRGKTRQLLRLRGKSTRLTLTQQIKSFEVGEKAVIKIAPQIQGGSPHPRYYGKAGTIVEKRGRAYLLEIKDGDKTKRVLAFPAHLKKA